MRWELRRSLIAHKFQELHGTFSAIPAVFYRAAFPTTWAEVGKNRPLIF